MMPMDEIRMVIPIKDLIKTYFSAVLGNLFGVFFNYYLFVALFLDELPGRFIF